VDSAWEPTEQWVRELANQGLNVSFLPLPFDVASLRNLVEAALEIRCEGIEEPVEIAPHPRRTRPPRIVVVYPEELALQAIEFMLRRSFINVELLLFGDSQEAWEELLRATPDLLITYDLMPMLRGKEIVQRLADKSVTFPIVVLSGYGAVTEPWVHEYASRGLNIKFLDTPFDVTTFRKVVAESLKIPPGKNHER